MINLEELDNGDLEITVVDKEEFEILLKREFNDERHYLVEMLDSGSYLGNNWDAPMNLGLTEMPAIAYGAIYFAQDDYNDDGLPDDWEQLWGYENYQIDSYLEELQQNGKVTFTKFS